LYAYFIFPVVEEEVIKYTETTAICLVRRCFTALRFGDKNNKLHSLSSLANYTERPPHVGNVSAKFCG
jgi:hypothetical protein